MKTAAEFLAVHGRLPKLGDDPAPWTYQGWALPYVQHAHGQGQCPDRWGHWLNVRLAGRLIAEPIPRVSFSTCVSGPELRAVEKWLSLLERRSRWGAMELLVDFLAWGLKVGQEQPQLELEEGEKLYRTVDLVPWLRKPSDYLGAVLAEQHGSGWNPYAFYPTPHELCEMATILTMQEREGDVRSATAHDPCCGTGRMLLHASNYTYRLSGQDIDPMMVKVTKINGALFAPWIAFPFPDSTFDGARSSASKSTAPTGQMELFR